MGNKKRIALSSGFTIGEFVVAVALAAIITGVACTFYMMSKDAFVYVQEETRMQDKAMFILKQMVDGMGTSHKGIQEAQGLITPTVGAATTQIVFIDQDDNTITRQFYRSDDNEVRYVDEDDNDNYVDIDTQRESDVQTLTFTRLANMDSLIIINLVLQRNILDKNITLNLSTSVRLRNI